MIDAMGHDLHASALAPSCHHQVQHALAQSAANVKEVAVSVKGHAFYDSEVLTTPLIVLRSELEATCT